MKEVTHGECGDECPGRGSSSCQDFKVRVDPGLKATLPEGSDGRSQALRPISIPPVRSNGACSLATGRPRAPVIAGRVLFLSTMHVARNGGMREVPVTLRRRALRLSPRSTFRAEKCRYRFRVLNLIACDISVTAEGSAN